MLWTGIRQVKETARGLFLLFENGSSVYLPKTAFRSPEQFQTLLLHAQQK
ncbi:YcxB family protein [Siccationidurans ginsengisoli]|nr:YcxB family protein [Hymenobacter sp. BT559]